MKISFKILFFVLLLFCIHCLYAVASEYGKVTSTKVSDGVYLFATTPYGDVGMSGNSVAVITSESVLIFDTTGTPESAATILEDVKKMTDKPVRYVVNSHWHWDHWSGNEVFLKAFPDVQIVTHEKTLELMKNVEPRWNNAGLTSQLPAYLADFQKRVEGARANHANATELHDMEELLRADQNFLKQKTSLHKKFPSVTFSDSMTIRPGGVEIQIRHARAITTGDTYLWLPGKKILLTGDVMLAPYPYAIGGTYPAGWLQALQEFRALSPALIIPGHGKPQSQKSFLDAYLSLFEELQTRVQAAKSKQLSQQQTIDTIGRDYVTLAEKLNIKSGEAAKEFKNYFLDIFVSRSYRETTAPLNDLPDGLPE